MKIYILLIVDGHSDLEVIPFTDPEKAIVKARETAKKYCRYVEDYIERDWGKEAGWLFYADYSCESDHVIVIETELQE